MLETSAENGSKWKTHLRENQDSRMKVEEMWGHVKYYLRECETGVWRTRSESWRNLSCRNYTEKWDYQEESSRRRNRLCNRSWFGPLLRACKSLSLVYRSPLFKGLDFVIGFLIFFSAMWLLNLSRSLDQAPPYKKEEAFWGVCACFSGKCRHSKRKIGSVVCTLSRDLSFSCSCRLPVVMDIFNK